MDRPETELIHIPGIFTVGQITNKRPVSKRPASTSPPMSRDLPVLQHAQTLGQAARFAFRATLD